ncbi:hypothetical protein [Photorhabdus luminescens]|uniref:hypothetical protein n=1 Tax=Photorhabdus luminescens TaxID=29488 RepID=UPI0019604023
MQPFIYAGNGVTDIPPQIIDKVLFFYPDKTPALRSQQNRFNAITLPLITVGMMKVLELDYANAIY